jgi:hypothetical protein
MVMHYYDWWGSAVEFSTLVGKTLTKIEEINIDTRECEKTKLLFHTTEGEVYEMSHSQDCCEWVRIEEIVGNLDDLVGLPILKAEEAVGPSGFEDGPEKSVYEHSTWTFYNLATVKGYVTLRWLGTSNGYYSESVDFFLHKPEEEEN